MQINELNDIYNKCLEQQFGKDSIQSERLASFKAQGLPTTKLENWKYTSLAKFLPSDLLFDNSKNVEENKTKFNNFGTCSLVFINGELVSKNAIDGIEIQEKNFESSFNRGAEDQLENLNFLGSSLKKSYIVSISKDVDIDLVFSFTHEADAKTIFSPRVQFQIAGSKTVKFFQQYNNAAKASWINPTFRVQLEKNANAEWNLNSSLGSENILTNRMQVEIERDATFNYTQNFKDETLSRTDFIVNLNGENATADLGGFYQLSEEQHHDTALIINHHKSHTYSHQLFKGILDDQSRGVFNGMVYIHKDAQQVDANQLNKNLLLSKKAHVDTRPQLQVYADDVKAAHGATIGQLDPDELFYLMARGIPQQQATTLLLAGYGQQVFEKVSNQAWKELVEQQNQTRS